MSISTATSKASPEDLLDGLATLDDPKLVAEFGEHVLDASMTTFLVGGFDDMINKWIIIWQDQWMNNFKRLRAEVQSSPNPQVTFVINK